MPFDVPDFAPGSKPPTATVWQKIRRAVLAIANARAVAPLFFSDSRGGRKLRIVEQPRFPARLGVALPGGSYAFAECVDDGMTYPSLHGGRTGTVTDLNRQSDLAGTVQEVWLSDAGNWWFTPVRHGPGCSNAYTFTLGGLTMGAVGVNVGPIPGAAYSIYALSYPSLVIGALLTSGTTNSSGSFTWKPTVGIFAVQYTVNTGLGFSNVFQLIWTGSPPPCAGLTVFIRYCYSRIDISVGQSGWPINTGNATSGRVNIIPGAAVSYNTNNFRWISGYHSAPGFLSLDPPWESSAGVYSAEILQLDDSYHSPANFAIPLATLETLLAENLIYITQWSYGAVKRHYALCNSNGDYFPDCGTSALACPNSQSAATLSPSPLSSTWTWSYADVQGGDGGVEYPGITVDYRGCGVPCGQGPVGALAETLTVTVNGPFAGALSGVPITVTCNATDGTYVATGLANTKMGYACRYLFPGGGTTALSPLPYTTTDVTLTMAPGGTFGPNILWHNYGGPTCVSVYPNPPGGITTGGPQLGEYANFLLGGNICHPTMASGSGYPYQNGGPDSGLGSHTWTATE